ARAGALSRLLGWTLRLLADKIGPTATVGSRGQSYDVMEMNHTIGQLAAQTGCKVQTVRYYEHIGLMPEPVRTEGNQRRYGSRHLKRLAFIRHSRQLGFPLPAIRELLSLVDDPGRSCAGADQIATAAA